MLQLPWKWPKDGGCGNDGWHCRGAPRTTHLQSTWYVDLAKMLKRFATLHLSISRTWTVYVCIRTVPSPWWTVCGHHCSQMSPNLENPVCNMVVSRIRRKPFFLFASLGHQVQVQPIPISLCTLDLKGAKRIISQLPSAWEIFVSGFSNRFLLLKLLEKGTKKNHSFPTLQARSISWSTPISSSSVPAFDSFDIPPDIRQAWW